jgi:hypothetical protein
MAKKSKTDIAIEYLAESGIVIDKTEQNKEVIFLNRKSTIKDIWYKFGDKPLSANEVRSFAAAIEMWHKLGLWKILHEVQRFDLHKVQRFDYGFTNVIKFIMKNGSTIYTESDLEKAIRFVENAATTVDLCQNEMDLIRKFGYNFSPTGKLDETFLALAKKVREKIESVIVLK